MVGYEYIVTAGIALISLGIFLLTREKKLKIISEIMMLIGMIALSIVIY